MTKNANPASTRNTVTAPESMSPPIPSGLDPEREALDARNAHAFAAPEQLGAAGRADVPRRPPELSLADPAGSEVIEQEHLLADQRVHGPGVGGRPADEATPERHQAGDREPGEDRPFEPRGPANAEPHQPRRRDRPHPEEQEIEAARRQHLGAEEPEPQEGPRPPRHTRTSLAASEATRGRDLSTRIALSDDRRRAYCGPPRTPRTAAVNDPPFVNTPTVPSVKFTVNSEFGRLVDAVLLQY